MKNADRMDLRIPPELKAQLQAAADAEHTSKAYIMLKALREHLSRSQAKPKEE